MEIDDSFDAVSPPPVRPASLPDQWRPHVEDCIAMKKLDDSARNEIVRSTVQVLFTKYKKPSRTSCDDFARKLILKYPFMKDDLGNGYVSYVVHVMYMYILHHEYYIRSNHGQIK